MIEKLQEGKSGPERLAKFWFQKYGNIGFKTSLLNYIMSSGSRLALIKHPETFSKMPKNGA